LRIKHPNVLRHSRDQQTDKTEEEPVSTKVRFSFYVPSVRKLLTDEHASRTKWEGKRGVSSSADKCSQNQKRRKSCRKTSAGQKTSNNRLYRSSSTDSGTEDTDHNVRKKSTKTPNETSSRSTNRNVGPTVAYASKLPQFSDTKILSRTSSPDVTCSNKRKPHCKKRSFSCERTLRKPSTSRSLTHSTFISSFSADDKGGGSIVKSVHEKTNLNLRNSTEHNPLKPSGPNSAIVQNTIDGTRRTNWPFSVIRSRETCLMCYGTMKRK